MKEYVTYRSAIKSITRGHAQLAMCVLNTINTHRILTALVVSVVANIVLTISLVAKTAEYRISNDATSKKMWRVECENDSLRGACVKYYNF